MLDLLQNVEVMPRSFFHIEARGKETVALIAARAAASAGIPSAFPDLQLTCDGKTLDQKMPMAACRINSETEVKLIARASDASLAEQLMGLVKDDGWNQVSALTSRWPCDN